MKVKFHLLLILGLLSLSGNSSAQQPLTLQDCLALAKNNNYQLIQLKTSIEKSQVGVSSAYSSYYPSVNFSSSYSNTIGGGKSGGNNGNASSSVGLSYSVYQGGNVQAGVKIAKAQLSMAEENYQEGEDEVFFSVMEAFFSILQKQEQISFADDILTRRKENLTLIKLKYEAGRESAPAVKEAEVSLLQAEYDKKQAENELYLAKIELNLLLGRSRNAELSVEYEDEETEFSPLEELIDTAKSERPDLQAARMQMEVLEAQITQAKSGYYPSVSLSSSYGWQYNDFADQQGNLNFGINLSLPLFDGFSRKAKVKEANLSIKDQKVTLAKLEQQIEQEIEQAYSGWELADKAVEISNQTLESSKEMYQLTKLQYEQGLTSYFILQQKESDLTSAENNYVNALYNLRVSVARLEKVGGRRIR
jgi:outer membrane protein